MARRLAVEGNATKAGPQRAELAEIAASKGCILHIERRLHSRSVPPRLAKSAMADLSRGVKPNLADFFAPAASWEPGTLPSKAKQKHSWSRKVTVDTKASSAENQTKAAGATATRMTRRERFLQDRHLCWTTWIFATAQSIGRTTACFGNDRKR